MQIIEVLVIRIAKYTHDKKQIALLALTRQYGLIWVHIPRQQAHKYGMDIGRIVSLRYTTKNHSQKYELEHVIGQITPPHGIYYGDIARILVLLALISRIFPLSLPIESIYDDFIGLHKIALL